MCRNRFFFLMVIFAYVCLISQRASAQLKGVLPTANFMAAGGTYNCLDDDEGLKCWDFRARERGYAAPSFKGVQKIAARAGTICVALSDRVMCWTERQYHADEARPPARMPVPVSGEVKGLDVAPRGVRGCVIDSAGLHCWTNALDPRNYSYMKEDEFIPSGIIHPLRVAVSDSQTCVEDDEGLKCWRSEASQRQECSRQRTPPVDPSACAQVFPEIMKLDFQVEGLKEFDVGPYGRLCVIDRAGLKCQEPSAFKSLPSERPPPSSLDARFVHFNDYSMDFSDSRGLVMGWDGFSHRQPGKSDSAVGKKVVFGASETCSLDEQNSLHCDTPPPVLNGISDLVATNVSFCAVQQNGDFLCWGGEDAGSQAATSVPFGFGHVDDVAVGEGNVCAIARGEVHCWGRQDYGVNEVPVGILDPRRIGVGKRHACVIDGDQVKCWGSSPSAGGVPRGILNPRDLFIEDENSCVLDDQGLRCWGPRSSVSVTIADDFWSYPAGRWWYADLNHVEKSAKLLGFVSTTAHFDPYYPPSVATSMFPVLPTGVASELDRYPHYLRLLGHGWECRAGLAWDSRACSSFQDGKSFYLRSGHSDGTIGAMSIGTRHVLILERDPMALRSLTLPRYQDPSREVVTEGIRLADTGFTHLRLVGQLISQRDLARERSQSGYVNFETRLTQDSRIFYLDKKLFAQKMATLVTSANEERALARVFVLTAIDPFLASISTGNFSGRRYPLYQADREGWLRFLNKKGLAEFEGFDIYRTLALQILSSALQASKAAPIDVQERRSVEDLVGKAGLALSEAGRLTDFITAYQAQNDLLIRLAERPEISGFIKTCQGLEAFLEKYP